MEVTLRTLFVMLYVLCILVCKLMEVQYSVWFGFKVHYCSLPWTSHGSLIRSSAQVCLPTRSNAGNYGFLSTGSGPALPTPYIALVTRYDRLARDMMPTRSNAGNYGFLSTGSGPALPTPYIALVTRYDRLARDMMHPCMWDLRLPKILNPCPKGWRTLSQAG
jgi:hypothetical protein